MDAMKNYENNPVGLFYPEVSLTWVDQEKEKVLLGH